MKIKLFDSPKIRFSSWADQHGIELEVRFNGDDEYLCTSNVCMYSGEHSGACETRQELGTTPFLAVTGFVGELKGQYVHRMGEQTKDSSVPLVFISEDYNNLFERQT